MYEIFDRFVKRFHHNWWGHKKPRCPHSAQTRGANSTPLLDKNVRKTFVFFFFIADSTRIKERNKYTSASKYLISE